MVKRGHLNSYLGTLRLSKLKLHVGMFRGQPPPKRPGVNISPSLNLDIYLNLSVLSNTLFNTGKYRIT